MRGTVEAETSKPANSGFWDIFINAFGHSKTPSRKPVAAEGQQFRWPSSIAAKDSKTDQVIPIPDPFQVIPAPSLGHLNPKKHKGDPRDDVNQGAFHTEEIKEGGMTKVIVGSFEDDNQGNHKQAAVVAKPVEVFSRPAQSQVAHGGGQSLSVSYKLAVGPSHDVYHHEDGREYEFFC